MRSRVLIASACALAATAAIAHAADRAAGSVVTKVNRQWSCRGPQDGTVVTVTMTTKRADAIHLDAGCTGSIVVHVRTATADGIKIHRGVHDLQITGDITCTHRAGHVHQDGIQAMGGRNVLIGSTTRAGAMRISCPSGNNGGVWINAGKHREHLKRRNRATWPTHIVVDHADILERNAAVHIGAGSVDSGVRNSVLHRGASPSAPPSCVRVEPDAVGVIDANNRCVGT
jgi:hypothetical protein